MSQITAEKGRHGWDRSVWAISRQSIVTVIVISAESCREQDVHPHLHHPDLHEMAWPVGLLWSSSVWFEGRFPQTWAPTLGPVHKIS